MSLKVSGGSAQAKQRADSALGGAYEVSMTSTALKIRWEQLDMDTLG